MNERIGASRSLVLGFAVAGAVVAAAALVVALAVARGQARGHAFFHLTFGVTALALFTAVGLLWRPPAGSPSPVGRTVLLVALWAFAVAALFESVGAAGYDEFNDGRRIEWLTTIHGIAAPLSGIGFLLVPLVALASVVSLVTRWTRGRRARAEGPASR